MTRSETFISCAIACVVSVAVAASLTMAFPDATANKPKEVLDLTVKSLTVKGPEGKGSIVLSVTDKGPGIWMTNPNGDYICVTALNDGANHAVWLYRGNQKEPASANVAIGMDSKGAGVLQFRDSKQNIRFLPLEQLADLPLDKLLNSTTK